MFHNKIKLSLPITLKRHYKTIFSCQNKTLFNFFYNFLKNKCYIYKDFFYLSENLFTKHWMKHSEHRDLWKYICIYDTVIIWHVLLRWQVYWLLYCMSIYFVNFECISMRLTIKHNSEYIFKPKHAFILHWPSNTFQEMHKNILYFWE